MMRQASQRPLHCTSQELCWLTLSPPSRAAPAGSSACTVPVITTVPVEVLATFPEHHCAASLAANIECLLNSCCVVGDAICHRAVVLRLAGLLTALCQGQPQAEGYSQQHKQSGLHQADVRPVALS